MKRLHAKTLDELADLILGASVGYYRTVKDINGFFQSADPRFPLFDGIPSRSACTAAFLQSCNREPTTPRQNGEDPLNYKCLEAVILELADPRTYPNDRDTLQTVVDRLNAVLKPEGLEIIYDGHAPRLRGDSDAVESTPSTFPTPNRKVPDFSRLTSNALLVDELNARWEEANRCSEASAHLATVIVLGSILEAALQSMIHDYPMQANCSSRSPKSGGDVKQFRDWSLSDCIEVAHDNGWIQADRTKFSHALRELRNLVHPFEKIRKDNSKIRLDGQTCRICWEVVDAAIHDIIQAKAAMVRAVANVGSDR